jgi:hypothetical protein
MIAASTSRVERNTADEINRARDAEIEQSLAYHAGRPGEIPARLGELDREWDIERAIEANAATVSLAGLALAAFVDRRFLLLPVGVAGFLLQHAIQGWCPPVPVLRRLGFRTPAEINEERCGLRAMRGDFRTIAQPAPAIGGIETIEEIHEAVEA